MRLSDHCFAVTGLAYVPPWSVNAGLIAGDRSTLVVDTGANALAAETIYGYAEAVGGRNEILVLNTEPHFDHIGGNGYFRARGCDIFGHFEIRRTSEEFNQEIEDFGTLIRNPARRERGEAHVFYRGAELKNPNRPLYGDCCVDLGGCQVEILATPGHTPSNLSVWVGSERVLYCGDCLTHGYLPNLDFGGEAAWSQWLASLDRIERLEPRTVVCGHGSVCANEDVSRTIHLTREILGKAINDKQPPPRID